jgi:AraC-like DNA-binding protein
MMMPRQWPLSAFPLMHTGNVEEIQASFARIYGRPVMEFVGRDHSLRAVVNHCKLQHIELNYGAYAGNVRLHFPESIFVSQIFPTRGSAEAAVQGQSMLIDREHSVSVSGGAPLRITSDLAYERLILCVNSVSLTNQLAAMIGGPVAAPLQVHPWQTLSHLPARLLRENLMFLVDQISRGARLHPLVLAEFEQSVMLMFLRANRHNYSHLLERDPPHVANRDVRLAEEYIEAHWERPISVEALAAQTGVGVRGLFRDFLNCRGYSLSEFARQVRLRNARELLEVDEASVTLESVAAACGFADVARFNREYKRAFGELPSATIARRSPPTFSCH